MGSEQEDKARSIKDEVEARKPSRGLAGIEGESLS